MNWIYTTLNWYFYLLVIGIIFYPMCRRFFGHYADKGYGFSKTVGILFISYTAFLGGILKVVPFSQIALYTILGVFAVINLYILMEDRKKEKKDKTAKAHRFYPFGLILIEELLFLTGMLLISYTRGMDPSIRGLEKFMDFGFMNSILRSSHFPPLDIWLSASPESPKGFPINYYYFGHLSGAMLIKLTGISPFIGYNLVLGVILGQGLTLSFSIVVNVVYCVLKYFVKKPINGMLLALYGVIAAYVVNLAGNLHTIYLFTQGYPNETPVPFWNIMSWYNPTKYWYPNATRFIPYTIHEFPSYSYVVADLHGHVFDIPFVLLTFSIMFTLFMRVKLHEIAKEELLSSKEEKPKQAKDEVSALKTLPIHYVLYISILLGFMCAVHYMTNAFDGPIYILLSGVLFFMLYRLSFNFFKYMSALVLSFIAFSYPFSAFFKPFVSGVALNCSPEFLVKIGKIGPFLFEKGKCQSSPLWMLFVLWGFFWLSLILFMIILHYQAKDTNEQRKAQLQALVPVDSFMIMIFLFGTYLIIVPEFFYIKDIYPEHFRANTMFKLGYQAFMMMGIASTYVYFRIRFVQGLKKYLLKLVFVLPLLLISVYPLYAFPSYYGAAKKNVELDGAKWLVDNFPEDKEIIDYINGHISGQPNILEAQGDSYTDYERISAYTGLPTLAGWWVHEWLWRGSADVVGVRIPDVETIYNTDDPQLALEILKKYTISYVVVAPQERTKYPKLQEEKFNVIGKKVFTTKSGLGALYKVK